MDDFDSNIDKLSLIRGRLLQYIDAGFEKLLRKSLVH